LSVDSKNGKRSFWGINMVAAPYRANQFSFASDATDDASRHGTTATGWLNVYEQLKPGPFRGRMTQAWLGPIQVLHEQVDGAFSWRGRPWRGARVLAVFLPSSGDLFCDGRPLSTNVLVTHRWDAVQRVSCSRRLELALIAIDEDYLNWHTARVAGRVIFGRGASAVTSSADTAAVTKFQRCVIDLVEELAQSPEVLEDSERSTALKDHVLHTIVEVLTCGSEPHERLPHPSTRGYIVDQAINYIETRLSEPISLADISAALRVCPRTLRYSFEHVLGISPTRYLLAARLNHVRRELVNTGAHASIQCAASRAGFWHMGRFAQYYRETFGELPSETCGQDKTAPKKHARPRSSADPLMAAL
jgi:AraC family transcriptional regulator, ethanolamine operon transcriptional activator